MRYRIKREPDDLAKEPAEKCIDCDTPTRYWLPDKHTPLCAACCTKRNGSARKKAKAKLKTLVSLLMLLFVLPSCTTVYLPNGEHYRALTSPWSVVNNTGVQLDVVVGGITLVRNMETGQSMPLSLPLFQSETVVVVVGHTASGNYVGTESRRFHYQEPYAWIVTTLLKPRGLDD